MDCSERRAGRAAEIRYACGMSHVSPGDRFPRLVKISFLDSHHFLLIKLNPLLGSGMLKLSMGHTASCPIHCNRVRPFLFLHGSFLRDKRRAIASGSIPKPLLVRHLARSQRHYCREQSGRTVPIVQSDFDLALNSHHLERSRIPCITHLSRRVFWGCVTVDP